MHDSINNNLELFQERFLAACFNADIKPADVLTIAVSKKKDISIIKKVYQHGFKNFGENFAQELAQKSDELTSLDITWHFIGPIQSNKVKLVAAHADWVHSIDREKIISKLNTYCSEVDKIMNVCVQVNIDNEKSKSGVSPDNLLRFSSLINTQSNLKLRGMMVLPKISSDIVENKKVMRKCFALHANLKSAYPDANILSMGTTSDFESAIQCGSNMIRIGESIFGKR
jgi:pyridoxal phosphate enzyme (YggS family)